MEQRTPAEVLDVIAEHDVAFVDFRFSDLPGVMQHVTIPAAALSEDHFETGHPFDGSSVRGFQQIQESDMILVPDADSHIARLTLVVAVRDAKTGGVSEPQEIVLPVRIPNSRLGEALNGIAVYPVELDLEAGAKLVAVALRDQLARVDALARLELSVGG